MQTKCGNINCDFERTLPTYFINEKSLSICPKCGYQEEQDLFAAIYQKVVLKNISLKEHAGVKEIKFSWSNDRHQLVVIGKTGDFKEVANALNKLLSMLFKDNHSNKI